MKLVWFLRTLVIAAGAALLCSGGWLAASAATSATHKLRVTDAAQADQLIRQGARLVADYGSFQVLESPVAPGLLATSASVEVADDLNVIHLNTGPLDTTAPAVQSLRTTVGAFTGQRLHLIQFAGPVKPDWRDALEQTGLQVVTYLPNDAYLVYGDAVALSQVQAWAGTNGLVQWEGSYLDAYKIHPAALTVDAQGQPQTPATDTFAIQLVADAAANPATLEIIAALQLGPELNRSRVLGYLNIIARLPAERLSEIAARPEVVSIQPYSQHRKFDERQDQILAGNLSGNLPSGPGYLAWLASKGFSQAQFTASGFVVDVSDSGIDNGSTTPGHFGFYPLGNAAATSRVAYNRLEGTPNAGGTQQGCDGHGTLNAHIIAGYSDLAAGFPHTDAAGFQNELGVCPFVKLGSSVVFDPDAFTNPDYANLQSKAYHDGARISANSWGADTAGAYDTDSQAYDALVRDAQPSGSTYSVAGNQPMVIVFAAGNAGPNTKTIGSPSTAKNVIAVGAAENVHSHSTANGGNSSTGSDGCGTLDTGADSASDIASFSSRGPCSDGRKKPDLVAPGTHITGGVAQNSPPPATTGTGSALACFTGSGVCGLPGGGSAGNVNNFFPLGQQFYTTSSGTSHSTPAVAGACALLRQDFINHGLPPPSPAMTKAFLMNSARYLTGAYANDTLPSNNQGLGEVNLGLALDGTARLLDDQTSTSKFTATGQTREFTNTIADVTKPLRVTLAWTDAPGSTTANAYNNDLDLTVTAGGVTYKGNVFSGANSVSGGSADAKNNVESVFLPAGLSGDITVTVTAANLNSDGVPNEAPTLDQDFALVIYNAAPAVPGVPVITSQPQSLTVSAGQSATFTVAATGAAPLSYQWQFNGVDLAGATSNSFTLAGAQPSDAGAYSVVVTNALGAVASSNATLTVASGLPGVIAQWNFNSLTADGSTGTGTTTPSVGSGTASLVGGASASFASGSSTDPGSADNSGWNTATYPAQSSANKSAGAQFKVSTAGQQSIVIRWDERVSGSASKYGRLQFSTNGTTFTDFATPIAMGTSSTWEAKTNDLSGIPGVSDNPRFAFRLVSEWQSTALGTNNAKYVTASASTYGTAGTVRLDMVTVGGTPIPPVNPASQLTATSLDTNGLFQFQVTGAAGSRYVVEASTNLTDWTALLTNISPFVFQDTNTPAPRQSFYRAVFAP